MIDSHTRNRILIVLFLGVLMGALDIAIVGPALPAIRRGLGVDERAAAWIFTTYVLLNLISTPLMAKLADTFGRRTLYVVDVSLFALGSLIVALSSSFEIMLFGRAVQGFGAGGIFPVASAVIGDTFPVEKRGRALGLIGAVFGIAFLIGPILAGVLLKFLSWHWLFLINLPIAAIVIWMSLRLLPAGRPAQTRALDLPGMVLLAALLASLAYGINRIDTAHFAGSVTSMAVWPFLLAAVLLLPVFVWIERTRPNPVVRIGLFRSRQIVLVSLLALGAGIGEASVVFVPDLLVSSYGIRSEDASFMLLPAVLAMAVGSPFAGRTLDRAGSRVVVLLGTALLAAGMFVIGLLVPMFGSSIVLFYVAAVLVGLGLGILLGAPLRYIMLNEAHASERAAAQGILTLHTSTGQLVGGALVGAVVGSLGGGLAGYSTAYLVIGVIALVLTGLMFGLKSRAEELATARSRVPADAQTA